MLMIRSDSEGRTREIGKILGKLAFPGMLIALDGDLGCGKTVFTKGFAEGIGIEEPVTSPTFTILQIYESGRMPLYHFDVYRIEEPEEMEEIGYGEYFFGDGACLVEWSSMIPELLPKDCVKVEIRKDRTVGTDYREIRIAADDTLIEAIRHETDCN